MLVPVYKGTVARVCFSLALDTVGVGPNIGVLLPSKKWPKKAHTDRHI